MYVCARFHEIPAKGLQDIKETKCYGLTDNVKTVYPPYNFVIAGGIKTRGYNKLYFLPKKPKRVALCVYPDARKSHAK